MLMPDALPKWQPISGDQDEKKKDVIRKLRAQLEKASHRPEADHPLLAGRVG
jgi:hypothetical protein